MPIRAGAGLGAPLRNAGAPVNGTDEVQTLTIGGTPDGGTFRLRFEGFTTGAITWSATNETLLGRIQTALRALPPIGSNGIGVTAGELTAGIGTVVLTFGGNRGKQAIGSVIAVETNGLTGDDPTVAVEETTPGVDATGRGAPKGSLLVDTTNADVYQNTGTALAPVWTKLGDNADVATAQAAAAAAQESADEALARVAANQADSTASDTAGMVADFNALLAKLKAAGLMAADAEG